MALPIMDIKKHQEDVIQQAREQTKKLEELQKSFDASGQAMYDAIRNAESGEVKKSIKAERDAIADEISSLKDEITQTDTKQLIFEKANAKTLNGVLGTLMGIKKFDRDKIKRQQKFWGKYFGTPGDFRQKFQGIADIGKNITASFDKIPGVQAIKSGVGTFFDIIKAGLLLVGGIVALQAFTTGFSKATERLGKGDLIAKFSSGLASIVQVFTGMDEEKTIELAKSLDSGFNKLKDILIGITSSLGRVLGIVPRIEGETDTIGTYLKDYAIALGTVAYIFPKLTFGLLGLEKHIPKLSKALLKLGKVIPKLTLALIGLGKFTTLTLIPAIWSFGAALLAAVSTATITIGMISIPLLPFIGIGLAIAAAFALLSYGLYKLYDYIMGIVDDNFGGIGNLLAWAMAYVKDGFANAINGIVGFINYLIEWFNSVPILPDLPLIPFEMEGGNVNKVNAKIAADVERLEREKAAEPPAGATPGYDVQMPNMPNIVNAPSSVVNNTSVTTAPLRPEPGASNSYRYTNSYMPN